MHRITHAFFNNCPCVSSSQNEETVEDLRNLQRVEESQNNTVFDNELEEWQDKYLEASIYLQEGLNNENVSDHPTTKATQKLYLISHNFLFYNAEMVLIILLMALSVSENIGASSICYRKIVILIIILTVPVGKIIKNFTLKGLLYYLGISTY